MDSWFQHFSEITNVRGSHRNFLLKTIILLRFRPTPDELFTWDHVSVLTKQPELFYYNKYWFQFIVICGKDMGDWLQRPGPFWGDFLVNSPASHLSPEESDQWVKGLDINMITASWAGSHAASLCCHYVVQPLTHAYRAFSWSGLNREDAQVYLYCLCYTKSIWKCRTNYWRKASWDSQQLNED